MSETRILRSRHAESILNLDRLDSPARSGSAKFLGKVVSPGSGVTLAADRFVLVNPTEVDGTEAEGGAVGLAVNTSVKIPGIVLGAAPAAGDYLVFTSIGGRWIARKSSPGGGGTPTPGFVACCPSNPLPTSITATFTFRAGTNAATYCNQLQNTGLTYMTTPPAYTWTPGVSLPPAGNMYFSPLLTDCNGFQFYYAVTCSAGTATFGLSYGNAGFSPSTFVFFGTYACSPLLVSGVSMSSPVYLTQGFGAAGDNVVVS